MFYIHRYSISRFFRVSVSLFIIELHPQNNNKLYIHFRLVNSNLIILSKYGNKSCIHEFQSLKYCQQYVNFTNVDFEPDKDYTYSWIAVWNIKSNVHFPLRPMSSHYRIKKFQQLMEGEENIFGLCCSTFWMILGVDKSEIKSWIWIHVIRYLENFDIGWTYTIKPSCTHALKHALKQRKRQNLYLTN